MSKLLMLKGLPASGKTTWAKTFLHEQPTGTWKRVNKDELRGMLDGGKWSKSNEKQILLIRDTFVESFLREGINVIVDDTNFAPKHEARLRQIARDMGAEFEIKIFDADVEDCIERDKARSNGVGETVIRRMWRDFVVPKTPVVEDGTLPTAILCDLDGTLADISWRNPYDASDVSKDKLKPMTRYVLDLATKDGNHVIYVSGREEKDRLPSEEWLKGHDCPPGPLFMRATDDKRKDWLVKQEIFDREIRGKYNVLFILDDRTQVVEMWRSMGLTCFQVAEGDF